MLVCPKCGSNYLTIKQRVGFEEFIMHFTPRRKYKCMGCGTSFRPPERRKAPMAPQLHPADAGDPVAGAFDRPPRQPEPEPVVKEPPPQPKTVDPELARKAKAARAFLTRPRRGR